jgi:hypothetical protein
MIRNWMPLNSLLIAVLSVAVVDRASMKHAQDCHGYCLKTLCTTLVPMPSFHLAAIVAYWIN